MTVSEYVYIRIIYTVLFSEMIGNMRKVERNVSKKDVPITVFNKSSIQITMTVISCVVINLSALLSFAVKLHWQEPFCL
jgi:hypothetical protein